jgi:hypothetical protein
VASHDDPKQQAGADGGGGGGEGGDPFIWKGSRNQGGLRERGARGLGRKEQGGIVLGRRVQSPNHLARMLGQSCRPGQAGQAPQGTRGEAGGQ